MGIGRGGKHPKWDHYTKSWEPYELGITLKLPYIVKKKKRRDPYGKNVMYHVFAPGSDYESELR